jgi:hypothetical protein
MNGEAGPRGPASSIPGRYPPSMRIVRTVGWIVVLALLCVLSATAALADSPGRGQLLVPGDHHLPGESMDLTGYQLEPGDQLTFTLTSGGYAITLVKASVGADGTISASAAVPSNYPTGYADVIATNAAGTSWRTTVLIGPRAEGPGIAVDSGGPFIEPAAIGLAMVVVGLIVFAGAGIWFLRGRSRGTGRSG